MISTKYLVILLVLAVDLSFAGDNVIKSELKGDTGSFKKSLSKDCATSYSTTCLKLDIVSWIDRLNENEDLSVLPGISLVKENNSEGVRTGELVAELAKKFPNDPEARLDAYLMKKVTGYLSSHTVKMNLWNSINAVEEGRGKGGKKGNGMEYLLAAAAMMKGTLMAVGMGGIAALAGKALMTGLMSLMLSAIIGIKSLSHHGHKSTTYEVIAKPIYTHSSSHSIAHDEHGGHYGHSSYGRSFEGPGPSPSGLKPEYKPDEPTI